jgi:hypothetical protein
MEKIQPTPAEVEEFWERCDLYAEERGAWSGKKFYSWFAPNKLFICDDAPPIDLNNLFRYFLIPLIEKDLNLYYKVLTMWHIQLQLYQKDPAISLFEIGLEVIHADR